MFLPKEVYQGRIDRLKNLMKEEKGMIYLFGNSLSPMDYAANTYEFVQDSTFRYFTGINEPDKALKIDLSSGDVTLFSSDLSDEGKIWEVQKYDSEFYKELIGARYVSSIDPVETMIDDWNSELIIHKLKGYRFSHARRNVISSKALRKAVISMRSIKDQYEIAELDLAADHARHMHILGMRSCRHGASSKNVYANLVYGASLYDGNSFPVIATPRGDILHNHDRSLSLESGQMFLADAGVRTLSGYCSDITRSYAVNGEFTIFQKDVYAAVLQALDHSIRLIKPGVKYVDVHDAAALIIVERMIDTGIFRGNADDIVSSGAYAILMPHGLGHALGLSVHDMEELGENFVGYDSETIRSSQFGRKSLRFGKELKPGMTLTVEPGIYFMENLIRSWKEQDMFKEFINYDLLLKKVGFGGVRLEDNIVVTEDGCRILGQERTPIEINDLEEIVGSGLQ